MVELSTSDGEEKTVQGAHILFIQVLINDRKGYNIITVKHTHTPAHTHTDIHTCIRH